jgi:hypothetical protein
MSNSNENKRAARGDKPKSPGDRVSKKMTEEEKKEARLRFNQERRGPPAPLMLDVRQAWKILCARTGCSIAMGSLHRWIRAGKFPTVRMGAKIFVPRTVLDDLIERCLDGESL